MIINQTGGGGLSINGVLRQYGVATAKIEAGDFVKYINGMYGTANAGYANSPGYAFQMPNNRALVITPDAAVSYATIVDFSTIPATVSAPVKFFSGTTYYCASHVAAVQLSDYKFAVFIKDGTNSSTMYVQGVVLTVSGNTISAGTLYKLSSTASDRSDHIHATVLSDGRILVAFNDTASDVKAMVVSVNGTVLSRTISELTFTTLTNSSSGTIWTGEISSGKAFVLFGGESNYQAYIAIFTVGTSSITLNSTTNYSTNRYSCYCKGYLLLDSTRLLVLLGGSSDQLGAVVLTVSGTSVTVGTATLYFASAKTSHDSAFATQKEDGNIIVFHNKYVSTSVNDVLAYSVLAVSGAKITIVEQGHIISEESSSGYNVPLVVLLGENNWFVIHRGTVDGTACLTADFYLNGVIKATESPADGVATINGKMDDIIDVYVPA